MIKPIKPEAYQLLHDGVQALAQVEHAGIRIDTDYLQQSMADTEGRINALADQLHQDPIFETWQKRYGHKTNLESLPQLTSVLFEDLQVPYTGERTATGRFRADAESLRTVRLPFVQCYLERSRLQKLRGTFLAGIEAETVDGFLHPFFDLHTVRTYRGSSSGVNFQNLPMRDPTQAAIIRRCFVPRPGRVFAEIDFSTLEFKGAACLWKDPAMLAYASDPDKDIHRDEAMHCYLLAQAEVSKPVRSIVKNKFVFPTLYGSYWVNTARDLWDMIARHDLKTVVGVPLKKHLRAQGIRRLGTCAANEPTQPGTFADHVKGVQEAFYARFATFATQKERWWQQYLQRGWFPLLTGFVCQGLYSKNNLLNYPIQGACFHCLLWCLIELQRWLQKYAMKTLIVGQIHDCLLLDARPAELQDVLHRAWELMTVDVRRHWDWIITPMNVEVDVTPRGGSWFDKAPWTDQNGHWQLKEA